MNGGPSQVDTFDSKPALARWAGKSLPMPNLKTERKTGAAFPSPFQFRKYGRSGIEVSELFSHTAKCIDVRLRRLAAEHRTELIAVYPRTLLSRFCCV